MKVKAEAAPMILLALKYMFLVVVVVACAAAAAAVPFIVRARREGARLYEKYSGYTRRVLAERVQLRSYPVKPEYQVVHPLKALKLIRIAIDSHEGEKFRRLNILDATMMVFMKMFTCFVLPNYGFNLPMLSVDIIFAGAKRVFVIEIIDPAKIEDENLRVHYDRMRAWGPEAARLEPAKVDMAWCKDIVADFSIHSKADRSKDDLLFEIYQSFLTAYLDMAENAQQLTPELSQKVQAGMEGYVNALLEKGGPAVNVFKFMLGPDGQKEYVRTVMFGTG